jgi:hypothetical protein
MSEPADWTAPGPQPRPKPGVIPLRPLGVGEILDGAIAYVRGNPVVTLGFSAVVITITQLVELPVSSSLNSATTAAVGDGTRVPAQADIAGLLWRTLAGAVVSGLVSFVATTVLTGLLIMVLGQAVLGRRMSLRSGWAATRPRLPGLLGLTLLSTLILVLVVAAGFVPLLIAGLAGSNSGGTVLAAIAALLVVCGIAVWLGTLWSMITPAYVLEGIPALRAFRRSTELVRGQWWRVFGILLLGGLIATVVSLILALPFGVVATLVGGPGSTGYSVVTAIGAIAAGTVTAPFSAGITGLLYFDQRMRREAFDLELLRATESPGGSLPTRPAPTAPPADGASEVSLDKDPHRGTGPASTSAPDDEDRGPLSPPR